MAKARRGVNTRRAASLAAMLLTGPAMGVELDPLDFSLGELMSQEVITVARKRQEIGDVAAAIHVVSAEDIARMGVTTLPDALRLVPGVQVAAISNNRWAVSVRGFNGRFANRLLVMVDGRTVYSPLFSGTFWEALDIPLQEIDRIEVIRGPGASIWGANAVNGIVNVITKWARATQGDAVSVTTGTLDKALLYARHGGAIDDGHFRVSYHGRSRRDSELLDGSDGRDSWQTHRLGMRLERFLDTLGEFSLRGDVYSTRSEDEWIVPDLENPPNAASVSLVQTDRGASLTAALGHVVGDDSEWRLQASSVYLEKAVGDFLSEKRATLDVDGQYRFALGRHDITVGSGLRYHNQDVVGSDYFHVDQDSRQFGLFSAFISDEYKLIPRTLTLTTGVKYEHHTWTGNEWQPNMRIGWTFAPRHLLWGAVSAASRTPARIEYDVAYALVSFPGNVLLQTSAPERLGVERMRSYEIGYRGQPEDTLQVDVTAFHMSYRNARALSTAPTITPGAWVVMDRPITFDGHARVSGVEAGIDWQPSPAWRARLAMSYLATSVDQRGDIIADSSARLLVERVPTSQISMHLTWKPRSGHVVDAIVRSVSALKNEDMQEPLEGGIDGYTELDLQYAHRLTRDMSVSLAIRNLLQDRHEEFGLTYTPTPTRQMGRSVHLTVNWSLD